MDITGSGVANDAAGFEATAEFVAVVFGVDGFGGVGHHSWFSGVARSGRPATALEKIVSL